MDSFIYKLSTLTVVKCYNCFSYLFALLHSKLVCSQVTTSQAFQWLSQLRHRWDEQEHHCYVNICDAQFLYSYEYLGNTPRLVITPLTDR